MEESTVKYILIVCILNSVYSLGPQPRIISQDGNLIFSSGENKNIRFVTRGGGKIFLNDADLTNAASIARNASDTMQRINAEYYDIFFQIQRFKRVIDGRQGILSRLQLLELGPGLKNSTNSSLVQRNSFSAVNRRVRLLQRKVNRLIRLLTKNECALSPCKNGGTCQDLFNGYLCQCPDEWEGSTCDKDVNECAKFAGTDLGCQNGATCVNKAGTYECICSHGWFGLHCTRTTTSCTSGSVVELCGHGTCIPQNNGIGYKCLCDQGWTTDGINPACVTDFDECKSNTPFCSINPPVPCVNTPGSFHCGNCPEGYTGNGHYCTDIDECAIFNGGCSVNPMVRCINTPGSKICGPCPPGYIGDGTSCSFRGICGINNGGCNHLAQCRDNPSISSTFVECICPVGYVGSGIGSNGCIQISQIGNPCANNPCIHGTCVPHNTSGSYICQCSRKFTGRNCDIRKDPCQPNPCLHGGTCQTILNLSFRCLCTPSYMGSTCQTEKQACGGLIKGSSGTIKYPQTHSHVYNTKISCAWIIQTNVTQVLNVTFTEMNLEESNNCRYDWLQIHDGRNTAAQTFGRFCGKKLPNSGNIISTHHQLYLWLRIDSSITNPSFELNWNSTNPVCGGSIPITSHGTLRSPGYPGNYPLNRDCYWILRASLGKRIQFHFFSLKIGNNPNCSYDFLAFHQGYTSSDRILAKYCNTSHPEPLYSAGPEVLIHFHSDESETYPGFQISYSALESIPGCGGVFTAIAGELSSPTENGRYPPDLICEYKIQVTENSRIKITFLTFDLEDDSNCLYDSLAVHEGGSSSVPLVNKYCGNKLPPPYTSMGNQLFIIFTSDWGNTEDNELGFRLKYETVCGGTYSQPTGVIESPGYPDKYSEDQICIYEIIQPLGTTISLTFTNFDMEAAAYPECLFDFVEIHDGDNENSTLIGQYCGESPPDIQSTYNYLWMKFESDSSVSAQGFRANYSTLNVGCGGILKSHTGMVKSPEHPTAYPTSSTCIWVIAAPQGYAIQLSWLLFKLEDSATCGFDYVEVYNNHTANELVGKYCGSKLPPSLVSTSNILTIKFVSDGSISLEGFMATYAFVDEESSCGGRYYTSSGIAKSPFYPKEYPSNRDCEWIITVNTGQQILLNVTDFDVESIPGCTYDFLEIRNGGTSSSPLIGKFCGTNIPKQIPSHANQMYILFHSDMSHSSKGFKITWESTATGCGGTLTSPRGSFTSPFYPEVYTEDTDCFWKIVVSAGSLVQIIFADIDLENHENCAMDYVEIFDGSYTNSKSLGKFCNVVSAPFIRSTTNIVSILFRSDGSLQSRGFHIQYSSVCQTTLKGFRGVIESPNFPNNYPYDMDCTWKIEVSIGNKINLTFSHFELESVGISNGTGCSSNFLEIKYTSDNSDMIRYNTYCGTDAPSLITINSNIAEIHYVTVPSILGSGFRLEWQIEGCGGILSRPSGSLSTPNYPISYPEATQCDWLIQLDYGLSIEITFQVVDIETANNCNFDYILVTNGPDDSYPVLTKICTKGTKPITVTSTGNTMFIRFLSDFSYHGRGFLANYTSLETKCGGKMSAPMGAFHSPNYPQNYDKSDMCEWMIEIEAHHVIELTFSDLDLAEDCTTDFIKIFDGPSAGYPVLNKLCGKSKPEKIRSRSNYMLVQLQTGTQFTAKGFLANYTTGCGARIKTRYSGIIDVHDSILSSLSLQNCSWTIINADPSQHVTLIITHINGLECDSDYPVKIFNGDSNKSPLLAEYCENKLPPPLTSVGNALHIELSTIAINFAAAYHLLDTKCGGTLSAESGFFATPRYPNNYPMDVQCEWTIQVAPGNRLNLAINSIDLVHSENCHLDYLEIRKENNVGKLSGIYCDETSLSIDNVGSLWILFKSGHIDDHNSGSTGKGFLAEYTLVHGIDLTGPTGRIASPLYPHYYFKSEDLAWTVTVTFGKAILITFIDFYVGAFEQNDCFLNKVEFYDGYNNEAPLITSLCGINIPNSIKSSSNALYIKIISELSISRGSRFLLEWIEVDIAIKEPTTAISNVEGCGSKEIIDLSELSTYNLNSPGYPYGYDVNLKCEWIYSTKPGYHLTITFLKLDLEIFPDFCSDSVKLYNKGNGNENWSLLATVCHPNSSQETIHGSNLIKIVFETDSYTNQTGFQVRIRKMCGGTLTDSNGVISVSGSEFTYFISCEWNVTVRSGRTIQVNFLQLNLQDSDSTSTCDSYVLLKNGHYPDSPILGIGKYCYNNYSEGLRLNTTANHLYVKYRGYPGKSFQASYKEMSQNCGGSMILSKLLNSTIISSPNYPNIPPPYTECYWTIVAPPGESLRLDFIERFDLTISSDCTKAAVEVRDGGSKYSPLIDTFCDELPNSSFSSGNMINIRFFTDLKDPRNGFKAKLTIASCGGIVRSEIGEVQSPNYNIKSMYPQNSDCTWHLIGPLDHFLILTFNAIDLLSSDIDLTDCLSVDHVTIEESLKFNDTLTTVGVYCGNVNPGEIRSRSNEVIIHFVSGNQGVNLAGFSLRFNSSRETCGGRHNTENGVIQSPGYPVADYNDIECEWTISVPEGRRISLAFDDLDLDSSGFGQELVFYNDEEYNSLIKNVKKLNNSEVIKSSGNLMHILFWGSKSSGHRGFQLHYSSNEPTICKGGFNSEGGVITTVNASTYYCKWKHTATSLSTTLAMTVTSMFDTPTPEPASCKYPVAALIITSENEKNVIAKLCRTVKQPMIVRSPYGTTKLIAFQNKQKALLRYTLSYATHSCGGIITNQDGFITSPGYPQKSLATIECAWLFKLPSSQQIHINFVNVNLDSSCEYNYIIIYNGDLPTSPKIGHFCQNNKPTTLTTQGNILLIEYHADEGSTGTGFKLQYQPVISGCGGIFHDTTRIIETPSYPNNYPNNAECEWQIISETGYYINLEFIDRFYLEQSENCGNDYLEVWDYDDGKWVLLGKKCGRDTPTHFNSTSNQLKILFRSNDKISGSGFKARWSLHCGGTFDATEKTRYIVSPGYPNDYNSSLVCIYKIVALDSFINIKFDDFDLEQGNCQFDNLTIDIGTNMNSFGTFNVVPNIYCGSRTPSPMRISDNVTITFKTDPWITRRGFKFSFKIDVCGGIINEPTVISSPGLFDSASGNELYTSSVNCYWNITAPPDKIAIIRFMKFELEHNVYCSYDFVEVFDGITSNASSRLALLCGNLTSQLTVIKSTSNSMTVHMKSDYTNNFSGFRAIVYFNYGPSAGCGGTVTVDNNKIIEAPLGLGNLDCQWEIITTKDHILKVTFTEIYLEPCPINQTVGHGNCSCNLIEVRDGGPFAELIEKVCDNTIPQEITTTGQMGWIRLYTLANTRDRAFKAVFTKIPSLCGPSVLNVTNQTQLLTSPGYPNPYPNNIKCRWLLTNSNLQDRFDLRFTDFDLVESSNSDFHNHRCSSDKVQITDKSHHNIISDGLGTATVFSGITNLPVYSGHTMPVGVHEYCGRHALAFDHYSGQNEVIVSFSTGFTIPHGKGFKMEYRIAGCNRNFTSVQGRFMAPDIQQDCILTITVPENYTISLFFLNFILYDTDECKNAGVEVYDGSSESAPKIARLCGYVVPDPIFSTSNKLLVKIWNAPSMLTGMFDATYTSSPNGRGCGGIFYNYAGKLTSPLYPQGYRKSSSCVWEIKVPQGMMIAFKFTIFDINGATVEVTSYNRDDTVNIVHHFTKNDEPAVIKSENNHLSVKYTTTVNSGGTGWVAQFLAVTTDTTIDWKY